MRKQNYSIGEIEEVLLREPYDITAKTIYQILKDEGFARLFRRTHAERRIALQQAKDPAEIATIKEFATHDFVKTAYGGVFLFIPMIMEMQLDAIFNQVGFYGSKQIPRLKYLMSFLALKLMGKEIIETYALRWLIENNVQEKVNNVQEGVDFFSLNQQFPVRKLHMAGLNKLEKQ